MTRTILTPMTAPSPYAILPQLLTFTAWDSGNGNRFKSTGKEQVVINNSHATLARTVTIISVADPFARSGDITAFSMAALTYYITQVFPTTGWMQSDGYIWIDGSTVDVKFAVVTQL